MQWSHSFFSVVLIGCKSSTHIPSYFDPRPPSILGLEGPGVLERGNTTIALRPPFNALAPLIVTPPFRFKAANRRGPTSEARPNIGTNPEGFSSSSGLFCINSTAHRVREELKYLRWKFEVFKFDCQVSTFTPIK